MGFPSEYSLQLIMETSHQEYTILLLFGWKLWQRTVSGPVSWKGAEELEVTPPSIGLHSKVRNQEFITEKSVLACLLLAQNAASWHFLRYDWVYQWLLINDNFVTYIDKMINCKCKMFYLAISPKWICMAIPIHHKGFLFVFKLVETRSVETSLFLGLGYANRTIIWLLKGILLICGPSSIICARAYSHYHQYIMSSFRKASDQSFQSATGLMRYDLRSAKIHFRPLGARFYEGSLLFGLVYWW